MMLKMNAFEIVCTPTALSVDPRRELIDLIGVPAVWDGSNLPMGS